MTRIHSKKIKYEDQKILEVWIYKEKKKNIEVLNLEI